MSFAGMEFKEAYKQFLELKKEIDSKREKLPLRPFYANEFRNMKVKTAQDATKIKKYVEAFAEDMALFEEEVKKIEEHNSQFDAETAKLTKEFDDYMRWESGLITIPEQYRDKVYSYAYSKGHSSGMYEVYLIMCQLVNEIFM